MRIIVVFLLSSIVLNAFTQKRSLTLEDFVTKSTFTEKTIDGVNSMNDGIHFTTLEAGRHIVKYSYKTGAAVDTLFSLNKVNDAPFYSFSKYTFSSNEDRILLETNPEKIYRHSYTAEYYIWDSYSESITQLSENGAQQVATFSPDGERIAFVRNNNIFIKTIRFNTEYAVTNDGKTNEIINGIPDWVYEEEFSYNKAFVWSPDSKMLLFAKFNESLVKQYNIPMYQGMNPIYDENKLYPGVYSYKYPKAGESNSIVTAHVHEIKNKTTIEVDTGEETDIYLPRLTWTPDGNDAVVMRLNRRQNELDLLYANPHTGETRTAFTEKNKRYIDESFLDHFTYLNDDQHFVVISERDGWSHLYLYKNTGFKVKQLTTGNFDVTNFYGYDPVKKIFYYQAAKESPLEREVYSLTLDGKKHDKLSTQTGTNEIIFSTNYKYYLNYFSNSQRPQLITLHDNKGKQIRLLEDNAALQQKLETYALPGHEFFSFKTSEGIELNGYMLKPSNFDPVKKYPVVMTQYSGPNSQEVANNWNIDWHYYLAEQGYIVACVDPRGTAARGEEFKKCTYLQLGKLESDDQVEAAKYLASLSFTDQNKIAIWGWSYGGFMTALSLEKGGDLFKAGVAVAPVTNWRYYDTVYTERFMRKPQENPEGYDNNSPISHPEGITGKLLIIHGTADDNVHVQNTYEFSEALVQANIPFDMHLYTNRNHSIFGGNTRLHLYYKIINYFEMHLK